MIKNFLTLILLVIPSLTSALSADIKDLFPKNSELRSCKMTDSVRVFKGDELFTYIDGGAEIYMEYGFKQVATANYSDINNNQFQVEIYEMKDSSSAFGAYTFYLNGEGKPFNAGSEGVFIDYYATFLKGNFLTVISVSEYKEGIDPVFNEIATGIGSKIPFTSHPPTLITSIRKSGLASRYIKYLKGNVGLSNVYRFIPGNSFIFHEGASFFMTDAQVIIMKFDSDSTASYGLSEALVKMKDANQETVFANISKGFSYQDYRSKEIYCVNFNQYIIVLIGKTKEDCNLGIEKVKKVIH
jgi:hypothetical protein